MENPSILTSLFDLTNHIFSDYKIQIMYSTTYSFLKITRWGSGLVLFLLLILSQSNLQAQAVADCSTNSSGILAQWNMDDNAPDCEEGRSSRAPTFGGGTRFYCPNINSGCGEALLGSKGHVNSRRFTNGICLANFYASRRIMRSRRGAPFDPTSTVWQPELAVNLMTEYTIPAGEVACIDAFSIKILQKKYTGGTPVFEKQGVAVYRNDVLIYSEAPNILPTDINNDKLYNFTGDEFCSDGAEEVKFTVVFGLVSQPDGNSDKTADQVGYDDITIYGSCGAPGVNAEATAATCDANGTLSNGTIRLTNFAPTDRYDFNIGSTYTGSATYMTANPILAGGFITTSLPNPASPQDYTVRVFNSDGCSRDIVVTLNTTACFVPTPGNPNPTPCLQPAQEDITPIAATCSGASTNDDAQIAVTDVTNADRIGISAGTPYTGSDYSTAQTLTGSAFTFTGLANPVGSQIYTIRIFNGADCFVDRTVVLEEFACGNMMTICAEILTAALLDPDSTPNNGDATEDDRACHEIIKNNDFIDLELAKTVNPSSGTTCPVNTEFTYTLTITNNGNMTATDIQVADSIPEGLIITDVVESFGYFARVPGWLIDSLQAGQTETVDVSVRAIEPGTFVNCAYIRAAFPENDPDSSITNDETANEDDDDCVTITVTGGASPTIGLEMSPNYGPTNTPFTPYHKNNE